MSRFIFVIRFLVPKQSKKKEKHEKVTCNRNVDDECLPVRAGSASGKITSGLAADIGTEPRP